MKIPRSILLSFGVLLGTGVSILTGEAIMRCIPSYRFNAMVKINHLSTNMNFGHRYRPSAAYGYELIPRATRNINAWGMRDKEYPLVKHPGTYRILLLGDSITENGRWSDIVEDDLNADGPCEILNSAVMGWGLYNYWLYIKANYARFNPDMVLIGMCLNDVREYRNVQTILCDTSKGTQTYYSVNGENGFDTTLSINPALFRASALYRFIMVNYVRSFRTAHRHDDISALDKMREMKKLAQGRILCVIFPYLKPLEQYNESERQDYDDTKSVLEKAGVEYLDLTPLFNRYGNRITGFRETPSDAIHFNREANEIKAAVIYKWLREAITTGKFRPTPPLGGT